MYAIPIFEATSKFLHHFRNRCCPLNSRHSCRANWPASEFATSLYVSVFCICWTLYDAPLYTFVLFTVSAPFLAPCKMTRTKSTLASLMPQATTEAFGTPAPFPPHQAALTLTSFIAFVPVHARCWKSGLFASLDDRTQISSWGAGTRVELTKVWAHRATQRNETCVGQAITWTQSYDGSLAP
jgi:hypothetical protein